MSEEKIHVEGSLEQAKEKKSKWTMVIMILLFAMLIILCGFVAFLQFFPFDTLQSRESLKVYFETEVDDLTYEAGQIQVMVPDEVLGTEIKNRYLTKLADSNYTIKSLYFDGNTNTLNVNLTYLGFYLPISFHLNFEGTEEGIVVRYDDFRLSRLMVPVLEPLKSLLKQTSGVRAIEKMVIEVDEDKLSPGLSMVDIKTELETTELVLVFDTEAINGMMDVIKTHVDPKVLALAKGNEAPWATALVAMLDQVYPMTEDQMDQLVQDFLSDQTLISQLAMMMDVAYLDELATYLSPYHVKLDTEAILLQRKVFIGQGKDPLIASLFRALDEHFEEKIMAFNQGQPFDITNMTTYTVPVLAQSKGIKLTEEEKDSLFFVFEDGFKISYRIDDTTYYVRGINDYTIVDQETYRTYQGSKPFIQPTYVDDLSLWNQVVERLRNYFDTDQIFIRFMKSDGESIFVVASTDQDPQDYWGMALWKDEEGIRVLDENVRGIANFMENEPAFNAACIPQTIESIRLKRIPEDIHSLIIDELYSQRLIGSKSETQIVYSSYDGRYIAFMLNTGKEYVYKVEGTSFGTYLSTVYTKEKAVRNWRDLSELILLQDPPQEEE